MEDKIKDPAAVALGKRGGAKNSAAQAEGRKRWRAAGVAARLKKAAARKKTENTR